MYLNGACGSLDVQSTVNGRTTLRFSPRTKPGGEARGWNEQKAARILMPRTRQIFGWFQKEVGAAGLSCASRADGEAALRSLKKQM